MHPINITEAISEADFVRVKKLIQEYLAWLIAEGGEGVRETLLSQNIENEMETLRQTYTKPNGSVFLVYHQEKAVAIAGIKRFSKNECEVKRMFVQQGSRGLGIGKLLLQSCIDSAQKLNYERIKLDTLDFMRSAIKLYTDFGFVEIDSYRFNSHKEARYFELDLRNS